MIRPSIRTLMLAQALIILLTSMGVSLGLVLVAPPPEPGRMNLAEMAYALSTGTSKMISLHRADAAPPMDRSALLEASLARMLDKPADSVRAGWIELPSGSADRGQGVVRIDGRDAVVAATPSGFNLIYGPDADLRRETLVPLFTSAFQQNDGSWLVGVPSDPARAAWRARIILAFALTAAVLAIPAWLAARTLASPIVRLERAVRSPPVSKQELPISGPEEMRSLAVALNDMRRRLLDATEHRSRMLAALAHDLRTPITALKIRTDAVRGRQRAALMADVDRLALIIERSLDFALSGSATPQLVPLDLEVVASDAVRRWQVRGEPVTLASSTSVVVLVDPPLLERVVENLIDNAVRYGEAARLEVAMLHGFGVLSIEDDGPGIPEHELARMLQPFERLDAARHSGTGGLGLGLASASGMLELMGGRLQLEPGLSGLRASALLPMIPKSI